MTQENFLILGYLTGSELGFFLHDRVVNLKLGQTPPYGKLRDADYDRGDFVFALAAPTTAATARSSSTAGTDAEIVFWETIKASKDANDFSTYLEQYPKGTFAALARNRLKRLGVEFFGQRQARIKLAQQSLRDLGLYRGGMDGVLGPMTQVVLSGWLTVNGYQTCLRMPLTLKEDMTAIYDRYQINESDLMRRAIVEFVESI